VSSRNGIQHHPAGGRAAVARIACRLKGKRCALGLSIRALAHLADVSRSTVRSVEAGRASRDSVMAVAEALQAYEAFACGGPALFVPLPQPLFPPLPGELGVAS
jgi:DNA-binding XRE family transcriptional regulator